MPVIDRLGQALQFNQEALNLRAERQAVLANNIANADTPNFKSRDFDFSSELKRTMAQGRASGSHLEMSRTSSRHIAARTSSFGDTRLEYRVPDQPSLDGNTVDMDRERSNFADNTVKYQASLSFMNSKIQGMKNALRPEQ